MSLYTINPYLNPVGETGVWKEIGRTALGSEADEITVSSLDNYQYYTVLTSILDGTGNSSATLRLGSGSIDTGNNYSYRFARDFGSDDTGVNQSLIAGQVNANAGNSFDQYFINNRSGINKILYGLSCNSDSTPRNSEIAGKWVNTGLMDIVNIHNDDSGNFGTGSEVVVLGYDPATDNSENDNFWEELASVTLTANGDTLDSGTFAAKNYLWVQIYIKNSGTINNAIKYNSSTGNLYYWRRNLDGDGGISDTAQNNDPTISMSSLGGFPMFANLFYSNKLNEDKISIGHTNFCNTSGSGNPPRSRFGNNRYEDTAQITKITITNSETGQYNLGSFIRVYGHD